MKVCQKLHTILYFALIGQNLVTWPHLAARKADSRWPCTQLKIRAQFLIKKRRMDTGEMSGHVCQSHREMCEEPNSGLAPLKPKLNSNHGGTFLCIYSSFDHHKPAPLSGWRCTQKGLQTFRRQQAQRAVEQG